MPEKMPSSPPISDKNGSSRADRESKELSPVVQKISEELESLSEEKNQMAIRVLCAGHGKESGGFNVQGVGFRLLGSKGEKLETMQFQLETRDRITGREHNFNFGSWGDKDKLAQILASDGITSKQVEDVAEYVRDASTGIEKQGDQWVLNQYGANSDRTITFEDFLKQ